MLIGDILSKRPKARFLVSVLKGIFILASAVLVSFVGKICLIGYGYKQPFYKISYLTRMAEQGDIEAARKLRFHFESSDNRNESLYWLRKGAAFGDREAQRQLYHQLEKSGDEKTRIEGLNSLMKAAENGDGLAQLELSNLYFEGRGVEKDVVEGEKWLRRSAASQFPPAMTGLSTFISKMKRDRKSLAESYSWARLSLDRVHPKSVIASDARRQMDIIRKEALRLGMPDAELDAETKKLGQQLQTGGARSQ